MDMNTIDSILGLKFAKVDDEKEISHIPSDLKEIIIEEQSEIIIPFKKHEYSPDSIFYCADFETTEWNEQDATQGIPLKAILLCMIEYTVQDGKLVELQRWAFTQEFTRSFISVFEQHYKAYKSVLKVYFHNTDFDVNFLRSGLIRNNYAMVDHSNGKNLETLVKKQQREGKRREVNKCCIRNSLALLPSSIKALGKTVDLPKLPFNPSSEAYCFRDCEIIAYSLHTLVECFNTIASEYQCDDETIAALSHCNEPFTINTLPLTLSSTAFNLFKRTSNDMYSVHEDAQGRKHLRHKMFSFPNRDAINEHWRPFYRGGFSCVFSRQLFEEVIVLDFNSLYPSVMAFNTFPVGPYTVSESNELFLDNELFYAYDVEVFDDFKYPFIPVKEDDGIVRYRRSIKRTTLFREELIEILKIRPNFVRKVFKVYECAECRPIFNYMKDLYELRLKYKALGSAFDYIIKIILNSTYGRFGMRTEREEGFLYPASYALIDDLEAKGIEYNLSDDGKWLTFNTKKNMASTCEVNVIVSAKVTALGRLKLIGALNKVHRYGINPIGCDTDSMFIRKEDFFKILKGHLLDLDDFALGVLKKENLYYNFQMFVAKEYKYFMKKKIKGLDMFVEGQKSKGIRTDKDLLDYYEQGVNITRPMKFKESLHKMEEIHENLIKNNESLENEFTMQTCVHKEKGPCWSARKFTLDMADSQPLSQDDEIIDEKPRIIYCINRYKILREEFKRNMQLDVSDGIEIKMYRYVGVET